jgi:NADH-quinone oxidoreductase subunit H
MNFYLLSLIKFAIVMAAFLTALAYLQLVERKVLGHIQLRLGPYRVGPHGLLQPIADVVKLLTKEGVLPGHVSRFFYFLAPMIAVGTAMVAIAVLPFGPKIEVFGIQTYMQLTDLNIGLLFVLAASSLGVYGIALAGWSSNNKYALLGGLRGAAQMVSYELPMAVTLAAPLLLANSLSFREIVESQGGYYLGFVPRWSIFQGPFPQVFAFIMYLISAFAETNRIPFDLPEAENELVAGYHTEYSSMNFAAFFMAEYANMVTVSLVAALVFLGGWNPLFPVELGSAFVPALAMLAAAGMLFFHTFNRPPRRWDRYSFPVAGVLFVGLAALFLAPPLQPVLVPVFWVVAKAGIILLVFIWVRGTLPRFRYDQLMRFGWGFLFPVAMLNLLVTALLVAVFSR